VNVPMPISRLTLSRDLGLYYGGADSVKSLLVEDDAGPVPIERLAPCDLSDAAAGAWAHEAPPGKVAVDPALGRLAFADAPAGEVVVSYAYGSGGDLGGGPYDRRDATAAALAGGTTWQMGVMRDPPAAQTDIVATLAEAVAAWNALAAGARGVIAVMDSRTYEEDLNTDATRIRVPQGSQLLIVAADWPEESTDDPLHPLIRRPGVVSPAGLRPLVKGAVEVVGTAPADSAAPGALIVNGILIQGGLAVRPGNLGRLELLHATLVPGTDGLAVAANPDLAIALTRSVTGSLEPGQSARSLELTDCIVDGDVDAREVRIEASTVLGTTGAETLDASNAILVGAVTVERRQVGCVRFSYLPFPSLAPRRFHCQPADLASSGRVVPEFASVAYGDPAYAVLATSCAAEIAAGAEDEGEMGAWHFVGVPLRLRNLRVALDEYLRFGLEAGIFIARQRPAAAGLGGAALRSAPRALVAPGGAPVPPAPPPSAGAPRAAVARRGAGDKAKARTSAGTGKSAKTARKPRRVTPPAKKRTATRSPGRRKSR